MHIPDDPQYYEKFYFTPGDLGFKSVKTSKINIGTLICWDQWFPEAARLTSIQGRNNFLSTAIGWHPKEKRFMANLNQSHGYQFRDLMQLQMAFMLQQLIVLVQKKWFKDFRILEIP